MFGMGGNLCCRHVSAHSNFLPDDDSRFWWLFLLLPKLMTQPGVSLYPETAGTAAIL